MLTLLRALMPEAGDVDLGVLREPLGRVNKTYAAFFRRIKTGDAPGYPRRKGKRRWKSMVPAEVRIGMVKCVGNGRCNIRGKGLPLLRVKSNRALPDSEKLDDLRIKREGRKLWACLTYKTEVVDLPETAQALGIEMGVSGRVVTSYGEAIKRIVLIDAGNGVWRDGFRAPSAGLIASERWVADYAREKAKAALRGSVSIQQVHVRTPRRCSRTSRLRIVRTVLIRSPARISRLNRSNNDVARHLDSPIRRCVSPFAQCFDAPVLRFPIVNLERSYRSCFKRLRSALLANPSIFPTRL